MALNTCMVFKVWYGRSCLEAKISKVEKQRREMGRNAMGKGTTMPLAWVKVKEVVSDAQEEHPPDLHCFFFFFSLNKRWGKKQSGPAEWMQEALVLLALWALLRQHCFHLHFYIFCPCSCRPEPTCHLFQSMLLWQLERCCMALLQTAAALHRQPSCRKQEIWAGLRTNLK